MTDVWRIQLGGFLAIPPPAKTRSGLTARQYRAARRQYRRDLRWARDMTRRLHSQASRTSRADRSPTESPTDPPPGLSLTDPPIPSPSGDWGSVKRSPYPAPTAGIGQPPHTPTGGH